MKRAPTSRMAERGPIGPMTLMTRAAGARGNDYDPRQVALLAFPLTLYAAVRSLSARRAFG